MVRNRSVPADAVLPHITYQNVAEALAWLTTTFGFAEHYRYGEAGGQVQGAQMHLGDAWIMLASARAGRSSPAQLGHATQSLTVFVHDVDGHFNRARSAGAKIVEALHETEYGERQYGVEDLEGHHWLFSKHVRDVSPDEWGATVMRAAERETGTLVLVGFKKMFLPAIARAKEIISRTQEFGHPAQIYVRYPQSQPPLRVKSKESKE